MKGIYFFIASILFCNTSSFGQKISIGAKFGWSNDILQFKIHYPEEVLKINDLTASQILNRGLIGGIHGDIPLKGKFSLHTEALYLKEAKGSGGIFHGENYVQFPQMIRYSFSFKKKSPNKFYVEAGTYFAFLFIKKPFILLGGPNNFDWGLAGGAGISHSWRTGILELNVRYQRSIFSLVPHNTVQLPNLSEVVLPATVTAFNQGFTVTVGYSFYLKTIKTWFKKNKHSK